MDLIHLVGILFLWGDAFARHPRVFQNVHFLGGRYLRNHVSVNYCIRYCQKLGNCWGVDYHYEMRVCSTHRHPSPCSPETRREIAGVDHFRIKDCREKMDRSSQIFEGQVAELKAHLDAKSGTYTDCLIHIYERSHAIDGVLAATGVSLKICADLCIDDQYCKSLDYQKYGGKCYFHPNNISPSQLDYAECCHHVEIKCSQSTLSDNGGHVPQGYIEEKIPISTTAGPYATKPKHYYTTTHYPLPHPSYATTTSEANHTASTRSPEVPTTDIPPVADDVCPFMKMPLTSRNGGDIVPKDLGITSAEMCKRMCLSLNIPDEPIMCFGADWDFLNEDCFLFYTSGALESSKDEFNLSNSNVDHYLYQPCSYLPSKRCIAHAPQNAPQDTAIAGENPGFDYEIVNCSTYCFYKFSIDLAASPTRQLERGCGTGQYMEWRQCDGPLPTAETLSTECHCVGDFCNAVSYDGLYHLYGYYPFDYNSDDLSGYNRHAQEVGSPKYVVFHKRSANTSLYLDGQSHLEIPSLTLIHRSDVQLEGDVRLSTAVTFWMKRTGDSTSEMTIISNTNMREGSSIEFYSKIDPVDPANHIIVGGVKVDNVFYKLESDPVPIGTWQFVALNLAGTSLMNQLQLYIEENPADADFPPAPSKSMEFPSESMNVDLTAKPVNIGKQLQVDPTDEPYYFEGFIDELRFFQGELDPQDIGALMRKTHYELSF